MPSKVAWKLNFRLVAEASTSTTTALKLNLRWARKIKYGQISNVADKQTRSEAIKNYHLRILIRTEAAEAERGWWLVGGPPGWG